jgi:uncharacterized protein (TIGR03086 family)
MSPTDPRPTLHLALDQAGRLIESVDAEQLDLPTPCDEYDVNDLVSHLLTVVRRIDLALRGGNALDIPILTTGIDDRAGAWKTYRSALDSTLLEDGVLTRDCLLPWATLPGAAAIGAYVGELTTHGWDLAVAIGRTELLDERLAELCLPMVEQFVPAEPRGGHMPFDQVVPVPADAPPYNRLAGWMGRQPAA